MYLVSRLTPLLFYVDFRLFCLCLIVFYVLIVLCLIMLFFILVACLSANSISVNPSDSTEDLVLDQAGLLLVHPVIEELGDRGRRHAVATDDLLVVPD